MRIYQLTYTETGSWQGDVGDEPGHSAELIFMFWANVTAELAQDAAAELQRLYPQAVVIGCSTGGVIQGRQLVENSVRATRITFARTTLRIVRSNLDHHGDSIGLGRHLGQSLPERDLVHVFTLANGLTINGSELSAGLSRSLPQHVTITGGLAGDGQRFQHTELIVGQTLVEAGAVAIGFYGSSLQVGTGSRGGWLPFGPERLVTASQGNVLMELDGGSALTLYEHYLGKHAGNLPASGHLFPMYLQEPGKKSWVVRTILGVDRERQTLIFGGDIPQGSLVRLMRARPDNLIDGAEEAGRDACIADRAQLAILISCVGRKMLLGQFSEEEIESVADAVGPQTALTGFYSYGEIAPDGDMSCSLHNQTMTVTVLGEND